MGLEPFCRRRAVTRLSNAAKGSPCGACSKRPHLTVWGNKHMSGSRLQSFRMQARGSVFSAGSASRGRPLRDSPEQPRPVLCMTRVSQTVEQKDTVSVTRGWLLIKRPVVEIRLHFKQQREARGRRSKI